jgi:hypothetical protein
MVTGPVLSNVTVKRWKTWGSVDTRNFCWSTFESLILININYVVSLLRLFFLFWNNNNFIKLCFWHLFLIDSINDSSSVVGILGLNVYKSRYRLANLNLYHKIIVALFLIIFYLVYKSSLIIRQS